LLDILLLLLLLVVVVVVVVVYGESEKYTTLKVPRQFPLTILVKEGLKLGKSLGSKGSVMGSRLLELCSGETKHAVEVLTSYRTI
jgi:hypothetical protein